MMRTALVLFAALSLFWFPWPVSLAALAVAALALPPAALLLGILADALYNAGSFPAATVAGALLAAAALFVRWFVKTRIM